MPEGKKERKLAGGRAKPSEKYVRQLVVSSPNFRGENSKNIWNNHHLDFY